MLVHKSFPSVFGLMLIVSLACTQYALPGGGAYSSPQPSAIGTPALTSIEAVTPVMPPAAIFARDDQLLQGRTQDVFKLLGFTPALPTVLLSSSRAQPEITAYFPKDQPPTLELVYSSESPGVFVISIRETSSPSPIQYLAGAQTSDVAGTTVQHLIDAAPGGSRFSAIWERGEISYYLEIYWSSILSGTARDEGRQSGLRIIASFRPYQDLTLSPSSS